MTSEDGTTTRPLPARTPIFDDVIAKAGIDWPGDARTGTGPEPDGTTQRAS